MGVKKILNPDIKVRNDIWEIFSKEKLRRTALLERSMPDRVDELCEKVEKLIELLEPKTCPFISGKAAIDEYNALAKWSK